MRCKSNSYQEIYNQTKYKKPEELSKQEVFDLYIGYGNRNVFCNKNVQKLMVKHNFIDWLVCSTDTIITDTEVIRGILSSDLLQDKKFLLINGRIESLENHRTDTNDFYQLIINVIDDTHEKKQIRYSYYKEYRDYYIQEIEQCINQDISIIVLRTNDGIPYSRQYKLNLCCIMKPEQ